MLQCIEGSANHVVGVRRADRLRDHVLDAERLEHRAHRTAGDDAGTRPEQHADRRGPRRDGRRCRDVACGLRVAPPASGCAWRQSVALRIASGTSRALPWPKPTRPFWSPITTSAAKPKRLPPLTTFATRLMWTSLSTNSLSRSSRSLLRSRPPRSRSPAMVFSNL